MLFVKCAFTVMQADVHLRAWALTSNDGPASLDALTTPFQERCMLGCLDANNELPC